jgi:hypothetical protein
VLLSEDKGIVLLLNAGDYLPVKRRNILEHFNIQATNHCENLEFHIAELHTSVLFSSHMVAYVVYWYVHVDSSFLPFEVFYEVWQSINVYS